MTRKKFIKELMGVGISRNTAMAAADAATRAEIPLIKAAGRILCMQRIFVIQMAPVKYWRKVFNQCLLTHARRTKRRIRPLISKNWRLDGLRIDWPMVDEMDSYVEIHTHQNRPVPGAKVTVRVGGGVHE